MSLAAAPAASRSLFVTLVGWLAVALGATLGTAFAIQWLLISRMPLGLADVAARLAERPLHPWFRTWLVHIDLTQALVVALAAVLLLAGVGVLRRRPWGRWLFIGLTGVVIAIQVGLVVLQHAVIASIAADVAARPRAAPAVEPDVGATVTALFATARLVLGLTALAVSAAAAWLGWRFASADVRAEFDRQVGAR